MSAQTHQPQPRFSPWRGISAWLSRVPIADPVDRRNAPMLQIVLLMLASLPPLAWAYRLSSGIPWRSGETLSLILSLTLSALAVFSVVLIRRGRLQWAVRQLMVVVAVIVMLSYAGNGFDSNRFEHPVQVMWLVIAGLMIGRRALWLMYGWTMLAFVVGAWRDVEAKVEAASSVADFSVDVVISAVIFLFIAIVIDRSISALRESLHEATRRSDALVEANQLLHAEMAERERLQTQLIHTQKIEAVGRLASGIAHDFNHLLGLILGYAERGRRANEHAEVQKALSGVEAAARRATVIGQKLLSFSRQDAAAPQVFDAGEALHGMHSLLRQLFDPAVEIVLDVPQRPFPIHFDHAQFELVVLNIAANAEHAMPDGGRFTVTLDRSHDDEITIDLRDTGHGIDDDLRGRIFDPFFTTKPHGQGTGLGLVVTRDIIQKAGGTIDVVGTQVEGATFRITLPVAAYEHRQDG